MMPTAHVRIETPRASRYLVQLCQHANQMGRHGGTRPHLTRHAEMPRARPDKAEADWSDTTGTITLTPWGHCTLTATAEALTLHVEAADPESLHNIQALLGSNLIRFGRRDNLVVAWAPDGSAEPTAPVRHGRRRAITLATTGALGVALMIALHLGVGGALAAWLGWTAAGVVIAPILLLVSHATIPVAVLRLRRRRS